MDRAQSNVPEKVFLVSAVRPTDKTFCQSFVHKFPTPRKGDLPRAQIEFYDGDDDWPQYTALPADGAMLNDLHKFDLFNNGSAIRVISIHNQYGEFQGSFYAVPPAGTISDLKIQTIVDHQTREPNPDGLRKLGFKVFAGDQIKNLDAVFTEVDAFRADGLIWLFERPTVPSLEAPTEVIARAQEDGSQKLVCTYQAQPNL